MDASEAAAVRLQGKSGNQVFFHQSFLASLFYAEYNNFMPFIVNDDATSLSLIAEFPEIKNHYGGHGTYVNMSVTLSPASGRFLLIDTSRGLGFGDKDDLYLTVEMFC